MKDKLCVKIQKKELILYNNKCYAIDCLIQDSCKSFKTKRCSINCKLYQ
jgi:hypothetical protein